jgi:hypothetical protein
MAGRVYVQAGEVVLCTEAGAEEGSEWATSMDPTTAEEMAHALLLCAHAARGFPVHVSDKNLVSQWVLR